MTASTDSPRVLVGSIDQGTSSTRFIVFDCATASVVAVHQTEFPQIYRHPGWCEHDPMVILETVLQCIDGACAKLKELGIHPSAIKAVGITNQRETTVVWDKVTGLPLHNAIVWLDGRTSETVKQLVAKTSSQKSDEYQSKVGLPLSTYFSAVKLRWILDHSEEARAAADDSRLMFGTVDSWLIYKLTNGVHVTDVSNASRTMLLNLETLQWDPEMIQFFGAEKVILPEVRSSAEVYGSFTSGPLAGIPISGCLGDQQAALVGQLCLSPGDVKNTYGTGCFMLFNTGTRPVISKSGLLTTVGYKLGQDQEAMYALEGSIAIAGAAVKWLRDNLGIISKASEIGELAAQVPDTGKVYFVPSFSGLFAPYWRDDSRGVIVGLTQFTTKHHICRATLEAVCWQSKEIIDVMNTESSTPLTALKVDGGLTASDLCMQIQADLLGIAVERPEMAETTALGAALAAGVAVGALKVATKANGGGQEIVVAETGARVADGRHKTFVPKVDAADRDARFVEWKRAVEKSFNLA
ncbi:hypothetical protein DFJ73DRAFT_845415 [Zopfochytrium polystomum]|nr:hypothetical protein DFJ73DRAFT_845415 [Zopfochytrium polystomum]